MEELRLAKSAEKYADLVGKIIFLCERGLPKGTIVLNVKEYRVLLFVIDEMLLYLSEHSIAELNWLPVTRLVILRTRLRIKIRNKSGPQL